MKRYAEDSGKRLAALRAKDDVWWESETKFFDVQRSGHGWAVRRIAHTAHHRGQQMAMLRMLARDLHSNYGPTADTGGLKCRIMHRQSTAIRAKDVVDGEAAAALSTLPAPRQSRDERPDTVDCRCMILHKPSGVRRRAVIAVQIPGQHPQHRHLLAPMVRGVRDSPNRHPCPGSLHIKEFRFRLPPNIVFRPQRREPLSAVLA